MIKAVLLGADGIVIKKRERLSEKLGVSPEEFTQFFKNEIRQAFVNKIDIKDGLASYLAK